MALRTARSERGEMLGWFRLLVPPLVGHPVAGLPAALASADYKSGATAMVLSLKRWTFTSTDLTLNLVRPPGGTGGGLDGGPALVGATGVGLAAEVLHDGSGPSHGARRRSSCDRWLRLPAERLALRAEARRRARVTRNDDGEATQGSRLVRRRERQVRTWERGQRLPVEPNSSRSQVCCRARQTCSDQAGARRYIERLNAQVLSTSKRIVRCPTDQKTVWTKRWTR